MVFCIIFKSKKHVYRPPKYWKKNNKMVCQAIFHIFTLLGLFLGENEKNGPTSHFVIFFSVFRRSIHMFFIFEYDTKNHEVSFSIWIFSNFTVLGTPGYPDKAPLGVITPPKKFFDHFCCSIRFFGPKLDDWHQDCLSSSTTGQVMAV